jgi:hypothetical protein
VLTGLKWEQRWERDRSRATGQVDATGRIVPVAFMKAKLEALRREAPFIDRVLVPWSSDYPGAGRSQRP